MLGLPNAAMYSAAEMNSLIGYKISKAKMKDTCAEIYALDANGARTELFLDPTNGAIVAKM